MGKQIITTELHPGGEPRTNGSGDRLRISVDQNVTHGPSGTVRRRVTLVMDLDEAVDLALQLLGMMPALSLGSEQYTKQMKRLRQYIAMAEAAPKAEHPDAELRNEPCDK